MDIRRDILWRVYLSFIGIAVFSFIVLGKAFYIQRVQGNYWRSMGDSLHLKTMELSAERGTIYSEDGAMLSTSMPRFDVYIDFGAEGLREKNGQRFRENLDSLSLCLARLFNDMGAADYKRILNNGYRVKDRYFQLKKRIDFRQYQILRAFPLVRLGRNKSGFIIDVRNERLAPFDELAARTIGRLRNDTNHIVGLEKSYDSVLRGSTGQRLMRQISGGAFVPVEGSEIEPENGMDVFTTIDINIQDVAETALRKQLIANQAQYGTCIVMEVATGKIKAIANLQRDSAGRYGENFNHAIFPSEPGSTFKLATLLAVLEDKFVNINNNVDLEGGRWNVGGRTVYDAEEHGLGNTSIQKAFEHSSNVGMAKLAVSYYGKNPKDFVARLRKLRLDKPTGIDLSGEGKPAIYQPGDKLWSNTTLPWMAFGYGLKISPMQTLMLYNAVANGGKMMKPYLVNSIREDGRIVQSFAPKVLEESIAGKETIAQLRTCLEGVVLDGTAKSMKTDAYSFAGKTGTSLVADKGITYDDKVYQSSFAGYFPARHPQYSCIVVIRNKAHAPVYFGAKVAGPVFREVADKISSIAAGANLSAPLLTRPDSSNYFYAGFTGDLRYIMRKTGIRYTDSAGQSQAGSLRPVNFGAVVAPRMVSQAKQVPDVRGMGLKDAIYLLESAGMKVQFRGRGHVSQQSIPPGSALAKTQTMVLDLNE